MHDFSPDGGKPHPAHPATPVESEGFASRGDGRDIFFAAVEATRMPMVVADPRLPDTPIVFANNAFLDMTGYAQEEVLGRNCRFLQGPDTDRAVVDQIRQAVARQQEIAVELINYRKDGSSFWNALFLTPVRNPEGELIYFFSSQLDVSRRRDAEGALHHSQKMEALGQLTGGIAHDFNNLLQVIVSNVEVASTKARLLGLDDALIARALSNVREAARKSGTLTQQLLAFARKQQLQGRVINLNELAQRLSDMADRSLGGHVELRLALEPGLWNTRIDPTQAEVALLNLLINARDAMSGDGQVVLRTANLRTDEAEADAHALPMPGPYVMLSVSDTGEGIAADVLPRVMEPFFTTKPPGQGTGLGLSMVYGFARQSGGTATIESTPGQGTTVRLYFPATPDDQATRPAPAPLRAGGSGRILVVDDRPEVAEMAALLLEHAGYETVRCHGAQRALELLEAGPPFQLLLTDLIMPGGMNGVMLARQAQQRQPALQVLLMTGFADGTPARHGGGHYDIVFKPFSAEELEAKVRLALARPAAGHAA
ncbi:histidine kinase famiy protein [Azohydromonas lata]|uniref:histidine kinase n=1 Tax=Azohydromonas lata TaxID=45677 RepID=A0ABU5IEX8_9BURK|nr:histidine kinase famiy protein [Azohydromonas lata]MDZ5457522.1 histidine kinase famiy protein [Azohydromonas lata]